MKIDRSVVGLPVIIKSRLAGHVADLKLDYAEKRLAGIYLSRPFGVRFIDFGDVEIIGEVSVMAKSTGTRAKLRPRDDVIALDADGRRVGVITGALIDEASGKIEAVELSSGLWEDILAGRRWIFKYSAGSNTPGVLIKSEGGTEYE